MTNGISVTIPADVVEALRLVVREAIAEEPQASGPARDGFLDVEGAAEFLSSTEAAIRSLVKRDAIPYYKTPAGRLLFDPADLRRWVTSGSRSA